MVARRIMVESMKIRHWAAFIALSLAAWGCVSGAALAAKPQSPLSLSWQLDSTPGADGALHLAVTVHTAVALDGRVQLQAPGGVEVLEGAKQWNGALAQGDTAFTWRLRVNRPGRVTVRVNAGSASNVHYSRAVTIRVPEGTAISPHAPAPPSSVHDGVREHPSGG